AATLQLLLAGGDLDLQLLHALPLPLQGAGGRLVGLEGAPAGLAVAGGRGGLGPGRGAPPHRPCAGGGGRRRSRALSRGAGGWGAAAGARPPRPRSRVSPPSSTDSS